MRDIESLSITKGSYSWRAELQTEGTKAPWFVSIDNTGENSTFSVYKVHREYRRFYNPRQNRHVFTGIDTLITEAVFPSHVEALQEGKNIDRIKRKTQDGKED